MVVRSDPLSGEKMQGKERRHQQSEKASTELPLERSNVWKEKTVPARGQDGMGVVTNPSMARGRQCKYSIE